MQGRALTPDVILSGNLSVSKTVNLQNKVIYNNGQYEADDGYDGLGKVTVSVHNEMTDLKATENGVYLPPEGYDGFDRVDVDVPDPELDTIHITQNGRYTPPAGVVGYDDIHVNVNPNLESKTITANGYYEPSQGKNGFSDVTVNVPERVPVIESKSITENGTYTAPAGVDGYSPITVNVPLPANAYLKKSVSGLPQPIVSFNDGADAVMQSLKVDIVPVQSGSGDPSPSNVRPISGWNKITISVVGDNWGDCADIPEPLTSNIWYTVKLPYNTYTISFDVVNVERGRTGNTSLFNINGEKNILADSIYSVVDGSSYQSKGASVNGRFYFTYTGKISSIGCYWRSNTYQFLTSGSLENIMIEVGNNPTKQFKPYNGHTYTIPFTDGQGQSVEVYGGSVDVVNGGGNAYKEYPSYNGETLIGPWISDRDVYTPNTTPTIGAQVVDMGDTTTFYTQPTAIKSLDGENNVFADTGDVTECEYFTPVQ